MQIEDAIGQLVEDFTFDALVIWADIVEVEHDEKQWLDDMWPEKDSELREKVAVELISRFSSKEK